MEACEYRTDKVNENITLIQRKDGLTFGTDAYLLYAYVKSQSKQKIGVDLGAGSGIISLLLASKGKLSKIYAVEVQEKFCELIKINAGNNSLADRVIPVRADVCTLSVSDLGGEADVVFTNPPYMKNHSGKGNDCDEKNIARREVLADIGDFCACGARLLKYGGAFYAVYRPERLARLFSAMKDSGIEPKRMTEVYPDSGSRPCLVLIEGRKGGAEGLFITPPLIMHKNAKAKVLEDTEQLKYIYENGEFDERYTKL